MVRTRETSYTVAEVRFIARRVICAFAVSFVALCCKSPEASRASPVLAVAADLGPPLRELAKRYQAQSGERVDLVFGASGSLAEQIAAGAPFDAFMSASSALVTRVAASGKCDAATSRTLAEGRLALLGSTDLGALRASAVSRIAIANPAHAPYGLAAQQALEALGFSVQNSRDKLVYAENVQAAVTLFDTHAVDLALVSASLSVGRSDAVVLLEKSLHAPIVQSAIECGPQKRAHAFLAYVYGLEGRAMLEHFLFTVPPQ
jgi:molybdate transport system substrate-binding protein